MQPTAEQVHREGLGRESSPPNSWPSSAATNNSNRTSLRGPLGRKLAWPRAFSRSRGWIPAVLAQKVETVHTARKPSLGAAPESVFSGQGPTPCSIRP